METTAKVYNYRRYEFDLAIGKINRRARKLGFAPIAVIPLDSGEDHREGYSYGWERLSILGEMPVLNGWRFLATVDHGDDGQVPLFSCAPEVDPALVKPYKDKPKECEHCGVKRYRRDTYILGHNDGSTIQVGSTCLKDFLPTAGNDPLAVARYFDALLALESFNDSEPSEGGFSYGEMAYPILSWLARTVVSIRECGWAKTKDEYGDYNPHSTSRDILARYSHHRPYDEDEKNTQPSDEDNKFAEDALDWARGLSDEDVYDNDFLEMIADVAHRDYVTERRGQRTSCIVLAYQKHCGRLAKAKVAADNPSLHFGAKGDKVELDVTLVGSNNIESVYGVNSLYTFVDEAGNIFKWFASRANILEDGGLSLGDKVKLRGTIKDHKEWQGVKETHLTRCKVI